MRLILTLVSPKNVILRAISAGYGEQFLPFLENPHSIPCEVLGEAIASRLKEEDCLTRGWILDGYPLTQDDAQVLKDFGINPNRYI